MKMICGLLLLVFATAAFGSDVTNEERFFIVSEKELSLSAVQSDTTGTPSGMPSGMATGTGLPTGNPTGVPTPTFTNPPVGDRFKFLAEITLYFAVTNYQFTSWTTDSTGAMKIALMETLGPSVLIIYSTLQVRGLSVSRRMLGEAAVVGQQSTTAYVTASFQVWLDSSCLSNANNVLSSIVSILESSITNNFSGVLAGCGFVSISKSVGGSYLVECSPSSAPTSSLCVPCLSLPSDDLSLPGNETEGGGGGPSLPRLAPPAVKVGDIDVKDIKITKKLKGAPGDGKGIGPHSIDTYTEDPFEQLLPPPGASAPGPSLPKVKLIPAPETGTLDLLLYASNNNGTSSWWRADGHGASYEITDRSGDKVFYVGTLCPGEPADSSCDISLRPGEYVFHVSGGSNPDKDDLSWQFCASRGGVETHLKFHVGLRGECIPMTISLSSSEDIDLSSQVDVIYEGTFEIYGFQGTSLSDYDVLVLENTMSSILAAGGVSSVSAAAVVSFQNLNSIDGSWLVTFRVATVMDVNAEEAEEQFVGNAISAAFQFSVSDGSFVSYLKSQAQQVSEQLSGLLSVSAVKLVSLQRVQRVESGIEKFEVSMESMAGSFFAVIGAIILVLGVFGGVTVGVVLASRRAGSAVGKGSDETNTVVPEGVPLQSLHSSVILNNTQRVHV